MKSKAALSLMEQLVMLLVFSIAAALCLQAFVWSNSRSIENANRDHAAAQAQSVAETIRSCGGDLQTALEGAAALLGGTYQSGVLWLNYDENWNAVDGDTAAFRLLAQPADDDVLGLCQAAVWVVPADAPTEPIFQLEIAWQGEVRVHA